MKNRPIYHVNTTSNTTHIKAIARLIVLLLGCSEVLAFNTHHATLNRAQAQYFSAPDSPSISITGDLTIEAWVRPVSQPPAGVNYGIVDKWPSGQQAFLFTYQQTALGVKNLFFAGSSTGNDSIPTEIACFLATDTWSHVAAVKQGTTTTIYLNGNPIGTGSAPATIFDNSSELRVGGRVDANEPFDGDLDDVRIWAVARTQDQIRSTLFGELSGSEPGLRGYWRFNNAPADSSGNGNVLTNTNGAVYTAENLPVVAGSSQMPACVDSFVKALWRFDGDTTDASGNLTSTTATNLTVSDSFGKFSGGANFNGSSSVLNTNQTLLQPGASFSISTWIKGAGWFCEQVQVQAQRYGLHCSYMADQIGFRFYQDDLNATVTNNPSEWAHIVLTYDGATRARKIYKNGILLASDVAGGDLTAAAPFRIGAASGNYFNGSMDDFAVFSRVLSSEEIMKYHGGIVSARFASDPADAILRQEGTSWTETRSAMSAASIESTEFIATEKAGVSYFILAPYFPFDTSRLPSAGIEINHATLNVYLDNNSGGSDGIAVIQTDQDTWNSITTADYSRRGTDEGSLRRSGKINSSYNTWPLNSVGRAFIAHSGQTKPATASAPGKTQLGLRWANDLDNVAPTERDFALISTGNASTNRPYLLVEYTAALTTASISGAISGTALPAGVIRVLATTATTNVSSAWISPGSYSLTGLPKDLPYQVTAYVDTNDNQIHDPLEWTGDYAANPLLLDDNKTGINITLAPPVDTDADGMPDRWETTHGLTIGLNDAAFDKDSDGLNNIQELWLGLGANDTDSDDDTLTDFAEVNWGTNPLLADTDQDGLPDRWETDHGLDPRRNDAAEDHDFDFVSNRDEYNGGINSTNPGSGFSGTDGLGDYVRRQAGQSTWQALYDRNDRLLGVRDARGTSFAYRYDGNGNLTHQAKLGLDTDGDGLSDLWEFAHRLDPTSASGVDGASGDGDSDGWTNLQEQTGQSDPLVNTEKPGSNGILSTSQLAGFAPTHFVITTGQLDNAGADEIVVGADGDPGTAANSVSIYGTASGTLTRTELPVDIGAYGVTSLAVGQLGTRPPAIYIGLRKPGGNGRVVELQKTGSVWLTSVIAESISEAAYVTGIRSTASGGDLILTFAPRFGPDGALYRAVHEDERWKVSLLNTAASHQAATTPLSPAARGPGLIITAGITNAILRLLDTGPLQAASSKIYQSVDEFNEETLSPLWSTGGTASGGSSWSAGQSGGLARLNATAHFSIGSSASASLQIILQPLMDGESVAISIPQLGHSDSRSGGSCSVRLGDTTIYSLGAGQNASNVTIHLFKMGSFVYFRTKTGIASWSVWSNGSVSDILRFEVSVIKNGAGPAQGAGIDCDYIRYMGLGSLVNVGSSPVDFSNAEAAYRSVGNTWYFKTPVSRSWRDAQLYAFARGGNLITVASAETSTWLQGKFPGEFWTGYYRDFATTPWKWVGNSVATFSPLPWASGQPGTAADQLFTFANNGTWSSASGTELKPAVFEIGAPLVEVTTTTEAEPAVSHRLQWAGQTLATGRFNSAVPTQSSVVEALIDDKDVSGTVTAGDEFVVAELVLDGSPAQTRTLVRRPFTGTGLSGSYGLAAVRSRAGTSDFLVTGEPDGQVFAWLPPSGGGPLTRHLLSVEHVGKSWQGLARVAMGGGSDGLVGLRVTPATPQTAELVFWSPSDLGFAAPPVIQQSLPSARIAPAPASGGAQSRVDVTLWDSEGNASRIALQYQFPPLTGLWQNATLVTVGGLPASTQPALAAPASGATHTTIWNSAHDLVLTADTPVLLRARATDSSGTGTWSEPMYYLLETTTDTDGDGMPDTWESANGLNPGFADSAGDLDKDGLKNLVEFALGLDPQVPSSVGRPTVFLGNATGAIAGTGQTGYLTLVVTRNPAASALSFRVEVSNDLVTWLHGPSATTIIEDTPTRLKVRDNTATTPPGRRFIRLVVSPP